MKSKNYSDQNSLKYWLALLRLPSIGAMKFKRILEFFPNLEELFQAPLKTLQSLGLETISTFDWQLVDRDLDWLASANNHFILTFDDPRYPPLLKEIADAPPLLFGKGDPLLLSMPQLALVGSRNPSPSGASNATAFAKELATAGIIVTSGLALGIDAASHQGALMVNGKTIAILGTGLPQIYPKKNQQLAEEIIAKDGTLVSELSIGTPAKPENFPRRNRIISGLAQGVVVVEATIRSGSLITARLANEQGREVFAIPGSIHNPMARGCHALIKQGAKLVEMAHDIMDELPKSLLILEKTAAIRTAGLDAKYLKLLKYLDNEPVPVDVLLERTQLPINQLVAMLSSLELMGHVQITTAGYKRVSYERNHN